MIEINITDDMLIKARAKSVEMGKIHNSILRGRGNMSGFIGEQIALNVLGGRWENTFDYDLVVDNLKVDVKTKQTSVMPLPHYERSIAKLNTQQNLILISLEKYLF